MTLLRKHLTLAILPIVCHGGIAAIAASAEKPLPTKGEVITMLMTCDHEGLQGLNKIKGNYGSKFELRGKGRLMGKNPFLHLRFQGNPEQKCIKAWRELLEREIPLPPEKFREFVAATTGAYTRVWSEDENLQAIHAACQVQAEAADWSVLNRGLLSWLAAGMSTPAGSGEPGEERKFPAPVSQGVQSVSPARKISAKQEAAEEKELVDFLKDGKSRKFVAEFVKAMKQPLEVGYELWWGDLSKENIAARKSLFLAFLAGGGSLRTPPCSSPETAYHQLPQHFLDAGIGDFREMAQAMTFYLRWVVFALDFNSYRGSVSADAIEILLKHGAKIKFSDSSDYPRWCNSNFYPTWKTATWLTREQHSRLFRVLATLPETAMSVLDALRSDVGLQARITQGLREELEEQGRLRTKWISTMEVALDRDPRAVAAALEVVPSACKALRPTIERYRGPDKVFLELALEKAEQHHPPDHEAKSTASAPPPAFAPRQRQTLEQWFQESATPPPPR